MTNELKQVVATTPEISHVYFNAEGEWLFFPRKGFTKKISRDDVLNAKVADTNDAPKTEAQEFEDKVNPKPGKVKITKDK